MDVQGGRHLGLGGDGFVAVDAVIALTLVAALLTLVLQSADLALRSSRAAQSRVAMRAVLQHRLLTEWPSLGRPGARSGRDGSLTWSIEAVARAEGSPGALRVCDVRLVTRDSVTRRVQGLDTVKFCQVGEPS